MTDRFQRALLNGQTPDWETIEPGMSQGSILEPFFFCLHINDLTNNLKSNVKLFADDTSLFSEICNLLEIANVSVQCFRKICEWAKQWKMVFNPALS